VTGQLTKITNDNPDPTKNRFYEYDALARLKTAKGGETGTDWQQNYSYDRYGNRLSVTKTGIAPLDAVNPGGTATAFNLSFANSSNRITTSNYEYDFAGNLTRGQDPDGNWQRYEYDAANRLKYVKNDAGTTTLAEYLYGASNQRLKTVDGSSTNTWYVWEGDKVIAEYNTVSGVNINWQKSYVYLGERLLATESTSVALQFHHPDRLGTRLVTNASDGSSAGEQETLPFGTALGAGIAGNNRRFTSYDRSTTTKLDYAVNRTYHAGLGRFTQVDPIGMEAVSLSDPQSLNLYAYCGNDPVNYTDPTGLFLKRLFRFIFKVLAIIAVVIAVLVAPSVGSLIFLGVGALFGLAGWHNGTLGDIARRVVTLGTTNFGSVRTPPINGASTVGGIGSFLHQKTQRSARQTGFKTAQEAAIAALKRYNRRSIKINREFAGNICRHSDQTYSYTPAVILGPRGGNASALNPCAANTQDAGWYHTHGAWDSTLNTPYGDGNEVFSGFPGDRALSHRRRVQGWLATPTRRIYRYDPAGSLAGQQTDITSIYGRTH
jgi:RHS repeat-associated protein